MLPQRAGRATGQTAPPVDLARLLAVAGGDQQLAAELVGLYLEQVPALVAEIDSALAGRDGGALRRAAHTLRGSLCTLAADDAAAAAQALELLGGAAGVLPGAGAAWGELARELARVDDALRAGFRP